MWRKRAHPLAHITKLYSTKVYFKCTDVEQNSFVAMKKIGGRDLITSYPSFSENFITHTVTSKMKFGEMIFTYMS